MAHAVSTSITRRNVVAGLTLTAASMAVLAGADNAYAQATQTNPEKSLYERLGGVFAIAAVVDHFSDAVVKNPCLLYTSDAADDLLCVDLGGRRIIKKKK